MHLMPVNCTLNNGENDKICVINIYYIKNLKKKLPLPNTVDQNMSQVTESLKVGTLIRYLPVSL